MFAKTVNVDRQRGRTGVPQTSRDIRYLCACVSACVCVCACVRARACVCSCVCARACVRVTVYSRVITVIEAQHIGANEGIVIHVVGPPFPADLDWFSTAPFTAHTKVAVRQRYISGLPGARHH